MARSATTRFWGKEANWMSRHDKAGASATEPAEALLLVTTTDEEELLSGDLGRLLDSLDPSGRTVVVLRDVSDEHAREVSANPRVLGVVRIGAAGISDARNAALDWIQANDAARPGTVVAFPDDDCRYPPGIAAAVHRAFADNSCDVLLGSYGPSPQEIDRARFPDSIRRVTGWKDLSVVASAGIFLRWGALDDLRFNPHLGVGAPLPAAEEIDLIVRLLSRRRIVTYDPRINVLHPYHLRADPYARWEAWIALCTAHALAQPRFIPQGLRVWLGWLHRVLSRQVPLRFALGVAKKSLNPAALNSIRHQAREAVRHG